MGSVNTVGQQSNGVAVGIPPEEVIFGTSDAMQFIRRRIQKIAAVDVPVLIQGAGGTGKEVLAQWIHSNSSCSAGEFVKVNCAAIPATLLESELFGYEKGAFTGAQTSKPGRVEMAHNGTLFLDEIVDLDMGLQSKLLHFLQDGRFSRIGDQSDRSVKVRLICSTHKDLAKEIEAGRFRADLFYRINVVQVSLPRLSERKIDIPMLAEYFRNRHMKEFGKESEPFEADIVNYWQNLGWPGNVRELANVVARYVLIGPDAMLTHDAYEVTGSDLARSATRNAAGVPLKQIASDAIKEMEGKVILEALRANHWNRRKTAQALKISYRALIYKIRNAGIPQRNAAPSTSS
jgi:two-component system response regulator AtoC